MEEKVKIMKKILKKIKDLWQPPPDIYKCDLCGRTSVDTEMVDMLKDGRGVCVICDNEAGDRAREEGTREVRLKNELLSQVPELIKLPREKDERKG